MILVYQYEVRFDDNGALNFWFVALGVFRPCFIKRAINGNLPINANYHGDIAS